MLGTHEDWEMGNKMREIQCNKNKKHSCFGEHRKLNPKQARQKPTNQPTNQQTNKQ